MPRTPPTSIPIPPPPPLDPSTTSPEENTNTLALLLPHLSLFAPPVLALLRSHYEQYGDISHWAPVKGFGRVIVVFANVEGARKAKREGDWLWLDVDLTPSPKAGTVELSVTEDGDHAARKPDQTSSTTIAGDEGTYFSQRKRRKSKSPARGLVLRLHPLPYTTLYPDPETTHLKPPSLEKNFLISPPGSPPEGWEPIVEDAPNSSTLAEDLQRALEALQLTGRKKGGGGKEVILEEGGVRVVVEDCTKAILEEGEDEGDDRWEVLERVEGGHEAFRLPSQDLGSGVSSGLSSGVKLRIAPTARPPI